MTSPLRFILGSGSSSRKLILTNMNLPFDIIKPNVDEKAIGDRSSASNAIELVLQLGEAKADNIIDMLTSQQRETHHVVITADQVVTHKGKILEKPVDASEARDFIRSYGDASCATVGSIVLTHIASGKRVKGTDTATIYLKSIPESIIDELIEEGEVFYCAGGLMIEHPKIEPYIERIEGTMDSIMGLSENLLRTLLPQILDIDE
jgi:septum formation protein